MAPKWIKYFLKYVKALQNVTILIRNEQVKSTLLKVPIKIRKLKAIKKIRENNY